MNGTSCPECEYRIRLGPRAHKGQRVVCPGCKAGLIIVQLNEDSVELDLAANHQKKRPTAEVGCPECESLIRLSISVREGQPVTCPTCHAELEVVSTDPIEVDFAMPVPLKRNRQKKSEKFRKSKK